MALDHQPRILWDWGTAYDLFASLHVLHHPERFGLRGSWAAGVRSRLTPTQRTTLDEAGKLLFSSPIAWVASIPEPRDAATVLWALEQLKPAERLSTLAYHTDIDPQILELFNNILLRGMWDNNDLNILKSFAPANTRTPSADELVAKLTLWSHADEFGESYLEALQAYVEVFFSEEERRITPYLQRAVANAQELATRMDFSHLMVELSQGVKIAVLEEAVEVRFVPSYWTSPLVVYDSIQPKHWVVLFGARPAEVGLVPGGLVPDTLLRVLKALSDPTRLLILRYLNDRPQTPSQLAKRLRLRAPTVIHHLNTLRLAGLVYISLENGEEKCYTVRESTLGETYNALRMFLTINGGS